MNHAALNVALYGPGAARWAMTERGRGQVARSAHELRIGPSDMRWQNGALHVDITEVATPWPRRVRGTVRITPEALPATAFALDPSGRHMWQPIAPRAHVEVTFDSPGLSWRGTGYLDSNFGSEPLEAGFKQWTWSRAHLKDRVVVLYDSERRDGGTGALALAVGPEGKISSFVPPPMRPVRAARWGIAREIRADSEDNLAVMSTLEDAPFYARSLIATELLGERVTALHESLSLDRFQAGWVKALLPFRMPRWT